MGIPMFGNNPRELKTEEDDGGLEQVTQLRFSRRKSSWPGKLQEAEARMVELQKSWTNM